MADSVVDPEFLRRRIAQLEGQTRSTKPPPLHGGGGGGTFDDMDARVSALEKRFDRVESKLDGLHDKVADLRVDMATIKERVSHLPTKGWGVAAIVTLVGLMTAIATLAPKLQQFFGILPR